MMLWAKSEILRGKQMVGVHLFRRDQSLRQHTRQFWVLHSYALLSELHSSSFYCEQTRITLNA